MGREYRAGNYLQLVQIKKLYEPCGIGGQTSVHSASKSTYIYHRLSLVNSLDYCSFTSLAVSTSICAPCPLFSPSDFGSCPPFPLPVYPGTPLLPPPLCTPSGTSFSPSGKGAALWAPATEDSEVGWTDEKSRIRRVILNGFCGGFTLDPPWIKSSRASIGLSDCGTPWSNSAPRGMVM